VATPDSAILLIHCPDRKGIVAAVSGFLYQHGANILHADQHQDNELALFFMRVEWALGDFGLEDAGFRREFAELAARFAMNWRVAYSSARPNVAILYRSMNTACSTCFTARATEICAAALRWLSATTLRRKVWRSFTAFRFGMYP